MGVLGLVVVALAISAYVGEQRAAVRAVRAMRPWFVATDVVGGLFGLAVAVVSFAGELLRG